MRASLTLAIAASLLLLAPVARAAEAQEPLAKGALKPKSLPAESDDEPSDPPEPGDSDEGSSDDGDSEGSDSDGSSGSDDYAEAEVGKEDLQAGKQELEEILQAEQQEIRDEDALPANAERLGVGNPLRTKMLDADRRGGEFGDAPAFEPEGDCGELVPELAGLDLAQLKASYDIPIEINDDVIQYLKFFQGNGRKWYARWLERSKRWIPFMRPILAEEGVPLDLVYLAMIESGFSPYAYSTAKASGFWQFISATGRRYGLRDDFWVDERRDPVRATHSAARYLKDLHREFGDWHVAWAAYNAGEGKLRRAIRQYGTRNFWELTRAGPYLRKETKHYVPKLIAAAIIAKHPDRFGFEDPEGEGPFLYDEVVMDDATDLQLIADASGVSIEEIQRLNPSLRRWVTPPARKGVGYKVRIPHESTESFVAKFEKVAPEERLTYRHHRVERGETLSSIAKKFSVAAASILQLNGVQNAKALRVGTDLILPVSVERAQKMADSGLTWKEAKTKRHGKHAKGARVARAGERPTKAKHTEKIASGKTYKVRPGDTLWAIAQRFGVTVSALKQWNGLSKNPKIQAGRTLVVSPPSKKGRG